jgi:putative toxin-antitoxin system antitoxin component (TIGR02293 family)
MAEIAYAKRIGVKANNPHELVEKIRAGLSYRAFEKLRNEMGLSASALAGVIQITTRTLTRRKASGRFRPDESDRLLRTSRIFEKTMDLFAGDHSSARAWLTSTKSVLDGKTPLELAVTEVGAREVESTIGMLERGVFG